MDLRLTGSLVLKARRWRIPLPSWGKTIVLLLTCGRMSLRSFKIVLKLRAHLKRVLTAIESLLT